MSTGDQKDMIVPEASTRGHGHVIATSSVSALKFMRTSNKIQHVARLKYEHFDCGSMLEMCVCMYDT